MGACEGRAAGPVTSPATAGDQPVAIERDVHGADRPAGPPAEGGWIRPEGCNRARSGHCSCWRGLATRDKNRSPHRTSVYRPGRADLRCGRSAGGAASWKNWSPVSLRDCTVDARARLSDNALREPCETLRTAAEDYSGTRIPSSATQEPVATTGNSWIPSTIAPLDGERRTSTSSP